MKSAAFLIAALLVLAGTAPAQTYKVSQTKVFLPQNKNILLLKKEGSSEKNIILFRTTLRVNTDGAPTSYHPQDPLGSEKALNNVCNAVAIRKVNFTKNLCFSNFSQAIGIFKQFRDNEWVAPQGFNITWANVLPTEKKDGRDIPCIFKSGEYKGYFGSLTALTNGLPPGQRGECEADNQINPLKIPAMVLVGGTNPVKSFGAQVGDLVVAYNLKTNLSVAAVIGDTGPADNLGEGSVAMNMRLLGITTEPKKKSETFALNVVGQGVLIAIIPASKNFRKTQSIYTAENINERVKLWQTEAGFSSFDKFIETIKAFRNKT